MFASFCFDHILFWQALCMRACVGLSWFSIPLCNCCVNPSHFRSLYGNNLRVTLLSLFHQICSYSVMEGSPRYPFFSLWAGSAPLSLSPAGSRMSSPAWLAQGLAVLLLLLRKSFTASPGASFLPPCSGTSGILGTLVPFVPDRGTKPVSQSISQLLSS